MTKNEVLQALVAGTIKVEEAQELLANLDSKPLRCEVSQKGGVSVKGLQRFPVTLYGNQWRRLATFMPTLLAFIEANKSVLAVKEVA